CVHGTGTQRLGVLDPATGTMDDLDLPYRALLPTLSVAGSRAALVAGSPTLPTAVVTVDVPARSFEAVRTAVDPHVLPDADWLPVAESTSLPGPEGRD